MVWDAVKGLWCGLVAHAGELGGLRKLVHPAARVMLRPTEQLVITLLVPCEGLQRPVRRRVQARALSPARTRTQTRTHTHGPRSAVRLLGGWSGLRGMVGAACVCVCAWGGRDALGLPPAPAVPGRAVRPLRAAAAWFCAVWLWSGAAFRLQHRFM